MASPSRRDRSRSPSRRDRSPAREPRAPPSTSAAEYTGGYGRRALKYRVIISGVPVPVGLNGIVPPFTRDGLNKRIVVVVGGERRIVPDSAVVRFNPETVTIDFAFDAWKDGGNELPAVLNEAEITVSRGAYRWAVARIEQRPDGMYAVHVAAGPPFVAKGITTDRSVNLNGPALNLYLRDVEPRDEPKFEGNYLDGRFWQGYGHPSKRFQNWSRWPLAQLAETRERDIRDRWNLRGSTPVGSCVHPGCLLTRLDYEVYCEEAGCNGGDACPVGGKHKACLRHGLPCNMMHPIRLIPGLDK